MSTFLQFLTTGLRLGSVYALIALGYTMVYGIIKLINFAHGDFIMVGGYTLFFTIPLMMKLGLPGWLAVILAVIICAVVGMLVELLAYRPVRKRGNNLTSLITAIAMSFILENLAQAIPAIGPDPRVPYMLFNKDFKIGSFTISEATVITIVVSALVMIALYWFTQSTKTGRAMRCVSEDKQAAVLMGINVNKVIITTFANVYFPVPQGNNDNGCNARYLRLRSSRARRYRFSAGGNARRYYYRHCTVRNQYLYQFLHVRYLCLPDLNPCINDQTSRNPRKECR